LLLEFWADTLSTMATWEQRSLSPVACIFLALLQSAGSWDQWSEVTARLPWASRASSTIAGFDDGGVVFAGGAGDNRDVWLSSDGGLTWAQKTNAAPWVARKLHCLLTNSSGNDVWMLGGTSNGITFLGDVWKSSDRGATWVMMTTLARFGARSGQSCVISGDALIVIGGDDGTNWLSDVWRSTDKGISWMRLVQSAWTGRRYGTAVTADDGSIIFMGGILQGGGRKNDVYRSTDGGFRWNQQTDSAAWPARMRMGSAFTQGTVYVFGGNVGIGGQWDYSLWSSSDLGVNWTLRTQQGPDTGIDPDLAVFQRTGMLLGTEQKYLCGSNDNSDNNHFRKSHFSKHINQHNPGNFSNATKLFHNPGNFNSIFLFTVSHNLHIRLQFDLYFCQKGGV